MVHLLKIVTIGGMLACYLPSFSQENSATVDVYADSLLAIANPLVYGSGDEIITNLSQIGLDSLVRRTGVSVLRFGAISCEYYDWEANNFDGVYYIDFYDTLIIQQPKNFGVDSILRFCERLNIEPILSVNTQINDPRKASRFVEYCNGDTNTPMGATRAQRGHPEPYDVKYWSLGNEQDIAGGIWPTPWGDWIFYRHFGIPFDEWSWRDSSFVTSEQFGNLVVCYVDSMQAHSPIPLEIIGLSLAGDLAWIGPVLDSAASKIDVVDVHYYPNYDTLADSTRYREWLASIDNGSVYRPPLDEWIDEVRDTIEAYSHGNSIDLAILEYNCGVILAPDALWWNYLDGLFIADVIGHFLQKGVTMAAIYSIYEESEPGAFPMFSIIRDDTLSRRMPSWVVQFYREYFGSTIVKCASSAADSGLEVYGSIRNGDTLSLFVVNKHLDSAYTTTINLHGFLSNDTMEAWDITNDTTLAAPWNGTKGIVYQGEHTGDSASFVYTFPKASVTALLIRPKEEAIHEDSRFKVSHRGGTKLEIYPNPVVHSSCIRYSIPETGHVELLLYNLAGQLVKTLVDRPQRARSYTVRWDREDDTGKTVSPGVYFIKLEVADRSSQVQKLLLLR